MAREILESGFTEDLEIVLILDKMQVLDFCACQEVFRKIKNGNAGRQVVKEAYELAKAEDEQRRADHEARNSPETVAKNKAEQDKRRGEWEVQREKNIEAQKHNPMNICIQVLENAETEPSERRELSKEQQDILADHLKGFFEEGQAANRDEQLKRVIDLHYNEFNPLELAAFVAGTIWKDFDLDALLAQMSGVVEESVRR